MKIKYLVIPIWTALLMAGCQHTKPVEVYEEFEHNISINTTPEGALVYRDDQYYGTTPYNFRIRDRVVYDTPLQLTIFKPGYVPVEMSLPGSPRQDLDFTLIESNKYLYNLLARRNIRFTERTNMDSIMMEPSNRPMSDNSAFILRDPNTDKEIRFRVIRMTNRYVWLETDDGQNVVYPIIKIDDRR